MALKQGERYRCPESDCGCEIQLAHRAAMKIHAAVAVQRWNASAKPPLPKPDRSSRWRVCDDFGGPRFQSSVTQTWGLLFPWVRGAR